MSSRTPNLLSRNRLALLEAMRKTDRGQRPDQYAPSIVPVSRDKQVPLSFAEQRLWFLHRLDPDTPVYNVPGYICLIGALDLDALKRTYNEMGRRHETLRTTFVEIDGIPTKVIARERTIDLPVVDLTHLSEEPRRAEVHRIATEEARKPFDLARGPLMRLLVLRLAAEEHLVLANKHHVISDGWSVGGFLYELATIYEAFSSGKPSPLPELEIQHADFAHWQRNWLQGEVLEERLRFWRHQLEGAPALLELPTDRPRPAVQSYRGGWQLFALPLELSNAIKAFSRQEEVTLFMTLLAAFEVLLHRYSGQEDIVVGSPMSSRNRLETEKLLGVIFNTLVLRVNLSGDPTFRQLVSRVREVALSAYGHQELPFEQLVEALQPPRSLSHAPIYQVMFVLQNSPMPEFRMRNLTVKRFDFHGGTSKYDLTWSVDEKDAFLYEKEQPLTGSVEFSTDLFERSTIGRMIGHYQTLLEAAIANPDRPISELPLMPDAERRLLLRDWNATEQPYPDDQRLPDLFGAQLERTPDAVALRYERETLTFRDLHARANQLAHHLQERGVGPETIVAICLERTPDLLVAILAVLQAGGAYLPLDPAYPADRLAFMLADAQAALLLTHSSLLERMPDDGAARVCLDRAWDAQSSPAVVACTATPDNLAYLIYTSGSTGRPKGVAITHRNAINLLAWARDAFTAEDRAGVLAATSVCFDLSIFELFLPLAYGGSIVLARNVLDLTDLPSAPHVTLINTVPSALTEVMRQGPLPTQVRCVNLAGERLSAELVRSAAAARPGVRIANLYGPSETTTYSTAATLDPTAADAPPIGCPIANTQIVVLDQHAQPVPIGVPGAVYIGGAGVARGYHDRPELTAERFVPDPFGDRPGARLYRTGDLARWRPDGQLEYLGRNDHQVKVRGFRIELGEIEHALHQHPSVREAVVVARTEGSNDVRLVAYVVAKDGANGEPADLRAFLKERLPEYMVPNVMVALDRLPRTPNGKIDRGALPDAVRRPEHVRVMTPPRTPAERLLATIWQELLKVQDLSVDDDFFALGGHSLLATRVTARLRRDAGVDLPLRAIFEAPTLAELAQVLERLQAGTPAVRRPDIRPAVRSATAPLSSAQQRLWFLDQLDRKSRAYTIAGAFHLAGPLDAGALQLSLQAIAQRHEALRTTFALVGREPIQEVHAEISLDLPLVDLKGLSEDAQEAEVLRHAQAEARTPFQLDRGPLVRTTLLALCEDRHVLLLTMHHIISDGWSITIFLNELLGLYEGFAIGKPVTLPPLPIQYADFAIWQRAWLQSEDLQAELAYWRRQLAGAPPLLTLPLDHPRPAVETHRGARHAFALPPALGEALGEIGRQHQATLFMTLLAAWQALLSGYSGQTDISVGSPVAGRTSAETEGLIGCFVNMLVLRGDLSGDPSFIEILQRVRQMTLEAYTNQDAPFEQLTEAFQPARALGYSPLFQVMFILQNAPLPDLVPSSLRMQPIDLPGETSKFDLTLAIMETPTGLRGVIEFKLDLFEQSTIERMAGHYQALLEAAVARPDLPLSQVLPAIPARGTIEQRVAPPPMSPRQTFLLEIEELRVRAGTSSSAPPLQYEAPRTATERVLAQIYKDLLKIEDVSVHDDFFARGGHSLLAVQLLARIRETFHIDLIHIELCSVFEAPSIAALSVLVDRAERKSSAAASGLQTGARSPLVTLHTGELDVACFCVHPGGGYVFCYTTLADHLGKVGLTVYGLEARGLDGTQRPQVRIESMASNYIDAIQAVQAKGPYIFVGWSVGGLVALEMAQQLTMQGERIALLAVLDSYLVESAPDTVDESMFLTNFIQDLATLSGKAMPPLPEMPGSLTADEQFVAAMQHAEAAQILPHDVGLLHLHDQYNVFRANLGAMLTYRAQPYPGRIHFFQAQDTRDDRSSVWEKLALGGFEKRMIAGNHYTMLRSPQVDALAQQLEASLQLT